MTIREKIKQRLLTQPKIWHFYQKIKKNINRILKLRYFFSDIFNVYRNMYWSLDRKSPLQLTSELLFQYHKLEKGLVMTGEKRFFGEEAAKAVLDLLEHWHLNDMSLDDPIYLGAIETLHSYKFRLESQSLDKNDKILSRLQHFLNSYPNRFSEFATPQPLLSLSEDESINFQFFEQLVFARRSVRSFSSKHVSTEKIKSAVQLAQLSPSACNRQSCRVYLIRDEYKKNALLALQNGNRGFGHLIPVLAVIATDSSVFFDASERHEPYVDGGLFSMSFMYALSSQGLSTCCLNWCVSPKQDNVMRTLLPLAESELVVMFMAIGYPESDTFVPRSVRKLTNHIMIEVD